MCRVPESFSLKNTEAQKTEPTQDLSFALGKQKGKRMLKSELSI